MNNISMQHLQDALSNLKLEDCVPNDHLLTLYKEGVEHSLRRHMNPREKYTGLRLSQLGKPAVLQALWGMGFEHDGGIALKQRITFHLGDVFESLLVFLLEAAGYKIVDHNNSTLFHETVGGDNRIVYKGVPGHSDIVVESPEGERFIVEAKTSNDRYFTSFMKNPDDERGYVTQLTLYEECLGLPGCWVFFNKNTSEIGVQFLTDELRSKAKARADGLIPLLTECTDWDKLAQCVEQGLLKAPPPVSEVYKRAQTGAYLVPPSMKFTKYRHCFYDIVKEPNGYGKSTEYVIGVRTKVIHPNSIPDD
jgi:hypothetical protein